MDVVDYTDLPKWYDTYTYIYKGYRANNMGYKNTVVTSLFKWHNETLNIYTHLLAAIYFAYNLSIDVPDCSVECKYFIYTAKIGSMYMASTSVFAHMFYVMSEQMFQIAWRTDFTGVIALSIPHLFMDTYVLTKIVLQNSTLCKLCLLIETVFAAIGMYRVWRLPFKMAQVLGVRYLLVSSFPLTFALSGYLYWNSADKLVLDISQASLNCTIFTLIAGTFFTTRIPERYFNRTGLFNSFNSHTIHHICIVIAVLLGSKSFSLIAEYERGLLPSNV